MIKIITERDEELKGISISEMKFGEIGVIINSPSGYNGHYVLRGESEAFDLSTNTSGNWCKNSFDWNDKNHVQLLPKNEKIVLEIYNT